MTSFYLIRIFTKKDFRNRNLDFNSYDSTKYATFTLKKSTLNKYDKIYIFAKCPHKNYHGEKKFWAEWPGISLLFSKSMPWLNQVYIGSLFGTIAHCYWWLIMKKRGWKLYRSPNPNPRGVRKCNSAHFCEVLSVFPMFGKQKNPSFGALLRFLYNQRLRKMWPWLSI